MVSEKITIQHVPRDASALFRAAISYWQVINSSTVTEVLYPLQARRGRHRVPSPELADFALPHQHNNTGVVPP